jgi:hypothetical protein
MFWSFMEQRSPVMMTLSLCVRNSLASALPRPLVPPAMWAMQKCNRCSEPHCVYPKGADCAAGVRQDAADDELRALHSSATGNGGCTNDSRANANACLPACVRKHGLRMLSYCADQHRHHQSIGPESGAAYLSQGCLAVSWVGATRAQSSSGGRQQTRHQRRHQ